ncbi:serine hydrolase [Alicyclobacillus mengziensis]|uniref:Serine hydrolase n=1 Tax=Alicyclobacillus mengziensis TaxID=2931921 RepID=A0A9X7Z7A8_9BACL|nr:serine hydrolase [Alicyclobacillus mengziensis]QSO47135.1 serine hydrolase [Alicyclobacillus mengziensis]
MLKELSQKLDQIVEQAPGLLTVAIEHLETGEQYLNQADEVMYAASVIKVPIMVSVFDEVHKGRLRLDERIAVQAEDMVTGSGSIQYLSPGLELPIVDLVTLMIIESDNTATNVLMDRIGLDTIQSSMKDWGLSATQLHNKLQIIPAHPNPQRNVITAREMTTYLAKMARGQLVSYQACRKMIGIMKWQIFNDGIPSLIPATDELIGAVPKWEFAHKTGWVTGIAHDVGILYLQGHSFVVSACAKDFTDKASIHKSMGQLGRALYDEVYGS